MALMYECMLNDSERRDRYRCTIWVAIDVIDVAVMEQIKQHI
jgi:hypothetical protein